WRCGRQRCKFVHEQFPYCRELTRSGECHYVDCVYVHGCLLCDTFPNLSQSCKGISSDGTKVTLLCDKLKMLKEYLTFCAARLQDPFEVKPKLEMIHPNRLDFFFT